MHTSSSPWIQTLGLVVLCHCTAPASAQLLGHADTLRGTIDADRAWWDVTHYDVTVRPDHAAKSIEGTTVISFRATQAGRHLRIDLQQPLEVRTVRHRLQELPFVRKGHTVHVDLPDTLRAGSHAQLTIHYQGVPQEARMPPWDGGWIWKTDQQGRPWMSVACQGKGASVWYPCKDHQSDEPDSAALHIIVPEGLVGVGNGRLISRTPDAGGQVTWTWHVRSPINTYNLVPYIGDYVHFGEVFDGAEGPLDLDHWVLRENETKAREQFKQVPGMLRCFEQWLGPYPFYVDGYKLVESPHLGMEHQSAVAYGNQYRNGYLGRDLSGTGHGLKWDFIIVHESGHEWFGNSITTADIADMWVHEGFTQYTEVIHTECLLGPQAAEEYVIGLRRSIRNDSPIIGPYGVNTEGSGDMYPKGANLVHTLRLVMGDSLFKVMLLEMNKRFRHQVVTSAMIEDFISTQAGRPLDRVFDQYLRTTRIPSLEWSIRKRKLSYRWANTVDGFDMPVDHLIDGRAHRLFPTDEWQQLRLDTPIKRVEVLPGYYIGSERVPAPARGKR